MRPLAPPHLDLNFLEQATDRVAASVRQACAQLQPVTHVGFRARQGRALRLEPARAAGRRQNPSALELDAGRRRSRPRRKD